MSARHCQDGKGARRHVVPKGRLPLLLVTSAGCFLALMATVSLLAYSLRPTEASKLADRMTVEVSGMVPGSVKRVDWQGFDVLILRRTPEQIDWLAQYVPPELEQRCCQSNRLERLMDGRFRSFDPAYFVTAIWKVGEVWNVAENRSTYFQCNDFQYRSEPIQVTEALIFPGGFYCDSGSELMQHGILGSLLVFDPAGRTQSAWRQPLPIPPHRFVDGAVVLGYRD